MTLSYSCPRRRIRGGVPRSLFNQIKAVWKQGNILCVGIDMRDCRGTRFRIFSNRTIGNEVVDPKLDEERPSQVGNLAAEDACGSPDGRWIMGTKRKGREVFCSDARAKVFVAIGDAKISTGFIPLH